MRGFSMRDAAAIGHNSQQCEIEIQTKLFNSLTKFADVYMPINGKVVVEPGQRVIAGTDLIGTVPRP